MTSVDFEKHEILAAAMASVSYGAVLVRPEMYHHRFAVADFIRAQGFTITTEIDRIVRADHYGVMYRDVFARGPALPSLPTRTMVYLDSPSSLMIFVDGDSRSSDLPIADVFCEKYKGKEAIPDAQTIRGGVVLQEALRLGFHLLNDKELQLALDPISALRNIVKRSGNHPHSHLPKDRSLLKYDAVSVHVPDSTEIMRDIAVMCTVSEIKEIVNDITG